MEIEIETKLVTIEKPDPIRHLTQALGGLDSQIVRSKDAALLTSIWRDRRSLLEPIVTTPMSTANPPLHSKVQAPRQLGQLGIDLVCCLDDSHIPV